MKKLMIATATLCAAVGANALESANTVGYQTTTPTASRKNIGGVPFVNTDGSNLDIQSIVCKDGANDPVNGGFKMWWYNAAEMKYTYAVYSNDAYADDGMDDGWGTEYTDKFYWITDDEDAFIYAPLGWKHDENAPATTTDHEKTFAAGEGFWIQPSSGVANPQVTIAGQVKQALSTDASVAVSVTSARKNLVTNPFPVGNYDIQDVVCKDGANDPVNGAFKMWWYNAAEMQYTYAVYSNDAYADDGMDDGWGTEYTDKFYWITDNEDAFIFAPLGWKHDENAPATTTDHEKKFAAGEGFWIQPSSGVANAKVYFPNPFYKAAE